MTMGRIQFLLGLILAMVLVLSAAPSMRAQDTPKVDLFGGYTYMRTNIVVSGQGFNLNGASGSVAYNFNNWLGLVGDFGVTHQGGVTGNPFSLTVITYQVGPRVSWRKNEHLIPFGQVLFGGGHAGGSLYTSSLGAGLAPLGTSNSFALTAGGGLDWKLNSTIGIRLFQAEYLYTQFQNEKNDTQNNFRFSAGIVFSFGKR
jgi:hypothetical protein